MRDGFGKPFRVLPQCLIAKSSSNRPAKAAPKNTKWKQIVIGTEGGTRTPSEHARETLGSMGLGDGPQNIPVRNEREPASPGVQSRSLTWSRSEPPTDAELERAIVDAVTMGLGDVARTLAATLEDRRRARAGNVVTLPSRPGPTRGSAL